MNEVLCLDVSGVLKSTELQKDIQLERLLLSHSFYADYTKDARMRPLRFAYSMRSCYTNKVIAHTFERDGQKAVMYYDVLTGIKPCVHIGFDLVMFIGSIAVRNTFKEQGEALNRLMMKSQFSIRGLYYPGTISDDPLIYSQIVFEDSDFETAVKSLNEGYSAVRLNDIKEPGLNYRAVLDDLAIIKKGDK